MHVKIFVTVDKYSKYATASEKIELWLRNLLGLLVSSTT
jgi:hypothetical protein